MIHKLYLTKKARTACNVTPGQTIKLAHGPLNAVIECRILKPARTHVANMDDRNVAQLTKDAREFANSAGGPNEVTSWPYVAAIRAGIMPAGTEVGEDIDLSAFGM